MLFLVFTCIVITIFCFVPGFTILNNLIAYNVWRVGDRMILSLWLGSMVIGVVLLGFSLFAALNVLNCVIVLAILVIASNIKRSINELYKIIHGMRLIHWLLLTISLLLTAVFMIHPVNCIDTGLYHMQLVSWLYNYGTVQGMSLIHGRLGFASAWFALSAPFHHPSISSRSATIMGSIALFWTLSHIAIILTRMINKSAINTDWFLAIAYALVLPYMIGLNIAISSSPDMPVILLTIILSWLLMKIADLGDFDMNQVGVINNERIYLVPLILSLGAVSVKVSALPLMLVASIFYFRHSKITISSLSKYIVIVIIMLAPLIGVNLVSTGCILFPVSGTCLDLPWSVGNEKAAQMSALITNFARTSEYVFINNDNAWWLKWATSHVDVLIYTIITGGAVIFILVDRLRLTGLRWVSLLSISGVSMMLYAAPWNRFGLGYLIISISALASVRSISLVPVIIILSLIINSFYAMRMFMLIMIVIAIMFLFLALFFKQYFTRVNVALCYIVFSLLLSGKSLMSIGVKNIVYESGKGSIIIPPPVQRFKADIVIPKKINDIDLFFCSQPQFDCLCWDFQVPCTPWIFREDIQLSDSRQGIKAGFVLAR